MTVFEYLFYGVIIAGAGGVVSLVIYDKIKGYTNLTSLKRLINRFKVKSSKQNNIIEVDNNKYRVESPHQINDSVTYGFSSGSSIGFSLKSIRQNYSDQDYFVSEMKKANQHLVDRGDVSDNDLLLILKEVWKKASA